MWLSVGPVAGRTQDGAWPQSGGKPRHHTVEQAVQAELEPSSLVSGASGSTPSPIIRIMCR